MCDVIAKRIRVNCGSFHKNAFSKKGNYVIRLDKFWVFPWQILENGFPDLNIGIDYQNAFISPQPVT